MALVVITLIDKDGGVDVGVLTEPAFPTVAVVEFTPAQHAARVMLAHLAAQMEAGKARSGIIVPGGH